MCIVPGNRLTSCFELVMILGRHGVEYRGCYCDALRPDGCQDRRKRVYEIGGTTYDSFSTTFCDMIHEASL